MFPVALGLYMKCKREDFYKTVYPETIEGS